jgi:hypothetical protein
MRRRPSHRERVLVGMSSTLAVAAVLAACNSLSGADEYHLNDRPLRSPDSASYPDPQPDGGPGDAEDTTDASDASTADQRIPIDPDAKRVFVTTGYWYATQLGGVDGADALCRQAAKSGGLGDVPWRAWISTSAGNAKDRIEHHGKYVRIDGKIVAKDFDELISGTLENAITISENGTVVAATLEKAPVWTGTNADGTLATTKPSDNCEGYENIGSPVTGIVGSCIHKTAQWTNITAQSCSLYPARLYCFEL